jgi:hypothetical protein
MAKNWKDDFNYDRKQDWLLSSGRSGRLVDHLGIKPVEPDVKAPQIRTAGGDGQKPVTAVIATESEPALTREEAVNLGGVGRGRR